MSNTSRSKAMKLRKSHAGWGIFMFVLIFFMASVILALIASMLITFSVNSKALSEADAVTYMAKLYDLTDEKNTDLVLSNSNRDCYVIDKDGNTLTEIGKNTCNQSSGKPFSGIIGSYSAGIGIKIYTDKSHGFLSVDESGNLEFDYKSVLKIEQLTDVLFADENYVSFPYWTSAPVNDGTLFVKTMIRFDVNDLLYVGIIILAAGVLLLFVGAAMLANIISNIVDHVKMKRLLFMDHISDDHNWVRFLIEGEEMLKKRRNKSKKYAVVNLVFVKYRNFVLCHSVEEGEDQLRKVYNIIRREIGKKDMVSHVSTSSFPILIAYKDEKELRMLIHSIIVKLEKIDSDHKFAFQAGVDLIPASPKKRKVVFLEHYYNNACAARMTLEDTDESGIAFFNQKIIDEHKWIDNVQERQQRAIDNEEFVVYYQPKYDPSDNSLKGAEALVRWNSPDLGFISPGKFIPIFEENGFITELDHYMIRHVARDQRKWLNSGYNCVPVSVNVSRAHFIEDDLADQIRDLVRGENCPTNLIEIELTESAFFDDKKALLTTIGKLKEYGFSVSMDDFGSGYSSLNSLKDLPLDVLKLDAGFFRGISDDDRGERVVSAAIQLAKDLSMKVVAEGVEEKKQVEFLKNEKCDMIQGFYFARPMPGEDYEARLAGGAANETVTESEEETPVEASVEAPSEASEPGETPEGVDGADES